MNARRVRLAGCFVVVVSAASLTGCGGMYSTSLNYAPRAAAPAAGAPSVTLSVADARPEKQGGSDPRRVGTIRALAGNGAGMREASPDSVKVQVEKATVDGLAAAGVAASPGQPAELAVAIAKFWMDGYASYTAEIEAVLTLRRGGKELWTRNVAAKATGEQGMSSPSKFFDWVWAQALGNYAGEVTKALREPEFASASGFALPAAPTAAPAPAAAAAAIAASAGSAGSAAPAAAPAAAKLGLSVQSEFGLNEKHATTFQVRAWKAMEKAELPYAGRVPPMVSIRYQVGFQKDSGGYMTVATVATRVSLVAKDGTIAWEEKFSVTGKFSTPKADKNYDNMVQAELGLVLDSAWLPELVKRLKSPGLAEARAKLR